MNQDIINAGLAQLAAGDPALAQALLRLGPPPPRILAAGFPTLLRIIVDQQLSTHAAAAIIARLEALMTKVTPAAFNALDDETLRRAGLSARKLKYARALATAMLEGALDPDVLTTMGDEEVVATLSGLRGFGRWSAEIYALFALGRRDIFPAGDLALREAMRRLKGLDARPDEGEARQLAEPWRPWRGVAALFLWRYYRGMPE